MTRSGLCSSRAHWEITQHRGIRNVHTGLFLTGGEKKRKLRATKSQSTMSMSPQHCASSILTSFSTGGRGTSQQMTEFNPSGTFHIRSNLKSALLRFREPDMDVNIWVDALCIDQSNKIEKKAQVARMHEVYTQADNVCIWLGVSSFDLFSCSCRASQALPACV